MNNLNELVKKLTDKNNTAGCGAMKELSRISTESDAVYAYFDYLAALLTHENSYVRNRALTLLADNARWDAEHRFFSIIDEYITHITDKKPITARQCIQRLPELACAFPELKQKICSALETADVSDYPDSMQPLVVKDIKTALRKIYGNSTAK